MGLFDGTKFERPVTCEACGKPMTECKCPRDSSGNVLLPRDQTATVRLDKRPGGKLVTTVAGLDPSATDLAALLKQLRSRCAAGGTVQDGQVQLQGDHRDAVAAALNIAGFQVKQK
jgi:translation initiation factor 1